METETLFEKIGYYWGLSNRKFSSLSAEEIRRYEDLEARLFEFEAERENDNRVILYKLSA